MKLPLDAGLPEGGALVRAAAAAALGVAEGDVRTVRTVKRSVDARKKRDVHFEMCIRDRSRPMARSSSPCENTSVGEPNANCRPSFSTSTRSDRRARSSMLCDTMTTVSPPACSWAMRSRNSSEK